MVSFKCLLVVMGLSAVSHATHSGHDVVIPPADLAGYLETLKASVLPEASDEAFKSAIGALRHHHFSDNSGTVRLDDQPAVPAIPQTAPLSNNDQIRQWYVELGKQLGNNTTPGGNMTTTRRTTVVPTPTAELITAPVSPPPPPTLQPTIPPQQPLTVPATFEQQLAPEGAGDVALSELEFNRLTKLLEELKAALSKPDGVPPLQVGPEPVQSLSAPLSPPNPSPVNNPSLNPPSWMQIPKFL